MGAAEPAGPCCANAQPPGGLTLSPEPAFGKLNMSEDNRYRVNPKGETPPQKRLGRGYSYRYAYARSADSRAADETGQDYLTFSEGATWFAFALCDGVSQSFFGDLAARILGDSLLRWLEGAPTATDAARLGELFFDYLQRLTEGATRWVQAYPMPEGISPMLRDVLEQKRGLGSEATFVCGRIDLPGSTLPQGQLLLAWMGDSRLRFWGARGERSAEFGDSFHTEQRWSTSRGPVNGRPHFMILPLVAGDGLPEVVRLLAYSDGLSLLDDQYQSLTDIELQDLIATAGESPTSDDVSVLEVWLGPVPERIREQPLPPVQGFETRPDGNRLQVRWHSLPGAHSYQIEVWGSDGTRGLRTTRIGWTSEPLPDGTYQVRVRALDAVNNPGLWSKPGTVRIGLAETVRIPPKPAPAGPEATLVRAAAGSPPPLKRSRFPAWGVLVVVILASVCLLAAVLSGRIPLLGGRESPVPTGTWTVMAAPAADTATAPPPTSTPSPTIPAATATLTPTLTLTPALAVTPTLTVTLTLSPTPTATATEPVSALPTPAAAETDLPSPLSTPSSAPGE
jgi:hypothetical protein